jgi:hypothetical protein
MFVLCSKLAWNMSMSQMLTVRIVRSGVLSRPKRPLKVKKKK